MIKIIFFMILISLNINSVLGNRLYIYGWFNSVPDYILEQFTNETGINVGFSSYENNETMYAKLVLMGKKSSYDIVFPSTYFIPKMVKANLLEELDKSKIKNLENISHDVLNLKFDPKNKFSVPYVMYFTGIMYNSKIITNNIDSWTDLFDDKYQKKVLLIDDMREIFHIGLSLLGYNVNTTNKTEIELAYLKLKSVLMKIKLFSAESIKKYFLSEEVIIGMNWNSDSYEVIKKNSNFKFIYPKEGAIFSMDNFVILKNAKNKENAYKFIDFIYRPDITKKIIEDIGLSIPNKATRMLLNPNLQNNNMIFVSDEIIKNSIIHHDLGSATDVYTKYWSMLKVED